MRKEILIVTNDPFEDVVERDYRVFCVTPQQLKADPHRVEGYELDMIILQTFLHKPDRDKIRHRLVRRAGVLLDLFSLKQQTTPCFGGYELPSGIVKLYMRPLARMHFIAHGEGGEDLDSYKRMQRVQGKAESLMEEIYEQTGERVQLIIK